MTTYATLCYILKDNKVLLQMKAKGLFGENRYNAPGGKLNQEEDLEAGVIREVEEETGLKVSNLNYHGKLAFYESSPEIPSWLVHVFSTEDFTGELKQNHREGSLEWIEQDKIPYSQMWEDDQYFVPLLLEGRKFEGKFWFSKGFSSLLKHQIEVSD